MKNQERSPKFLKERRFYTVLPLLVLPFLTLLFWTLGGGKAASAQPGNTHPQAGLNAELPGARLKDEKPLDKLSYYQQADADSAKRGQQIQRDPYFKFSLDSLSRKLKDSDQFPGQPKAGTCNAYPTSSATDPNERKIYEKLEQIDRSMNAPESPPAVSVPVKEGAGSVDKESIDRLEKMMGQMQAGSAEPDTEMNQLHQMMETILDIQHPQRVEEKLKARSVENKGRVYPVSSNVPPNLISTLGRKRAKVMKSDSSRTEWTNVARFYSLGEQPTDTGQNAIRAVVFENQTVVSGSTVKFRLLDDVFVNGTEIPKNTPLFGEVALSGDRLTCKISSIPFNNSIFPVQLTVFDMDGLDGIHIKGAISRDVTRQSGERAIQGIGMTGIGTSLEAQAASAAIEGSKSLFSKKLKLVEVDLTAGYMVLLKDQKGTD